MSYQKEKDGAAEVITYQVPDYTVGVNSFQSQGVGGFYGAKDSDGRNPFTRNLRKVKVRIERDDQGQLVKIVTDNDLSKKELTAIQKKNTDHYLRGLSPEQKEQYKKMNEGGPQVPIYQRKGAEISFSIKNGQCVPIEHREQFLTKPDPSTETVDQRVYNTELCHEIDDFLNKHPETAACFNPDLNKKMSKIFKNYHEPSKNNFGGYGPYGGHFGGGFGMGGSLGGPYGGVVNSLETHIMKHSAGDGNEEFLKNIDMARLYKSGGNSPVISSHMILENCYSQGLGSFIDDPTIWEAAGAALSPAKEEESSGVSR